MLINPTDTPTYADIVEAPSIIKELSERGKADFYFFCKAILGYKDLNIETHKKMCNFAKADAWKRKMHYVPRGHFKTTIFSIADPIHRLVLDPTWSTIIIHEDLGKAITNISNPFAKHFRENELFRTCYEDIIPLSFTDSDLTWNSESRDIRRPPDFKGPVAFKVMGVNSDPTGEHVRMVVFDDACARKAADSLAVSEKIIGEGGLFRSAPSILIEPEIDLVHVIGTRWAVADLANHIISNIGGAILSQDGSHIVKVTAENPRYLIWIRDIKNEDGTYIFPERFNEEVDKGIFQDIGPYQYSCQYRNNPIDPSNVTVNPHDLRYWDFGPDGTIKLYDPLTNTYSKPISLDDCDVIQVLDPSVGAKDKGSNTALTILACTPTNEVVVYECWSKYDWRKATPTFDGWLDQMYLNKRLYNTRLDAFESVAFQKSIGKDDIWARNMTESSPLTQYEIKIGGSSPLKKNVRIRNVLQPITVQHRLYVRRDQTHLIRELVEHPFSPTLDLLDTLGHGIPLLIRPHTDIEKKQVMRYNKHGHQILGRETGYGIQY